MEVPQAGSTPPQMMNIGYVQGRVDVPERFRAMLDGVVGKARLIWRMEGHGVWVEGVRYDHVVFADNIWIFAAPKESYARMVVILTYELEAVRLKWKKSSIFGQPFR